MVRLCFVFYINIIKVVSLLSFPDREMCVALRDRDERAFSYERVPTDAQKGRRKQEENENERKKILESSLLK